MYMQHVLAKAWLAHDWHSGIDTDSLQGVGKISQRLLSDVSLWCKAGNCPFVDLNTYIELLSSHVPHALVRHRVLLGPAAVLQPRRGQDPALDLHQSAAHIDTKGLNEGVVVVVRTLHEVADLPLAVRGRLGSRLYHG